MKRLKDLDIAIGFAIILVVFGHLLYENVGKLSHYVSIRDVIYKFHMPLFMFLSGFLMAYTYREINSLTAYKKLVKRKTLKFLPPYIFFSLLFLVFELVLGTINKADISQKIINIFITPSKSSAGFLWYVFVLFQYYLVSPLLMKATKNHSIILLLVAVILHFFFKWEFLNLNLFSYYLLFVSLGLIANKYRNGYYDLIKKGGIFWGLFFMSIIVLNRYFNVDKLYMGLCSIPAVHYMALLVKGKLAVLVSKIGAYSFYIYLMNSIAIGVLYYLLTSILKLDINYFLLGMLFLSGVLIPIFTYKYIISKTAIINKIIK